MKEGERNQTKGGRDTTVRADVTLAQAKTSEGAQGSKPDNTFVQTAQTSMNSVRAGFSDSTKIASNSSRQL